MKCLTFSHGSWLFFLFFLGCFGPDFSGSGVHYALASDSDSDSEYSFNWLDPDKKISVLQNRKFLKKNHFLISTTGGVGFSNPYRFTYNIDPRIAYYFSEYFGFEAFYTVTMNTPSSIYKALAAFPQHPQIREIRAQYGGMLQFLPWYAKINIFNAILHFDWYFGFGAGQVATFLDTNESRNKSPSYIQQNIFSLFFSTGQLFHLSQSFDMRIDITGSYYKAPLSGLKGDNILFSNYNFGVGIGWKG